MTKGLKMKKRKPTQITKRSRGLVAALLVLSLGFSLTACSEKQENSVGTDSGDGGGLEKVTVVLDYVPNTNHTGLYVAKELGYYEEAGLDVEIIEPADNVVTTLVATGKADYGISYQEELTYALASEEPLPIKAIATIIQHNTSGFATYKDKNIARPKDFEGKTYAGWGALSEEAVVEAVMKADGGDFSKVDVIISDDVSYNVLKDKIDIIWLFWAWDGIAAEHAGVPINYMELREFDERLDYYTPVIIANGETVNENADRTKAFLAATKKGYEYCVESPKESAAVLHKFADIYDIEMLEKSQEYLADKYIDDAESWGIMRDEVWNRYTEFMMENGLIEKNVQAEDCYTNEFLE